MPKHVQNFGISDKWLLSIFALNRKDAQTGKIRQIYGYEIDKNFAAGVYDGKYGQIVVQTMIFICKCFEIFYYQTYDAPNWYSSDWIWAIYRQNRLVALLLIS